MAAPTHKRFARSSAGEQSHLATGSSRTAAEVDSLHRFGPAVQPASAFDPACRHRHHPMTRRENPHCLAAVPLASRRNLLTRCSPTAAFETPELRPAAVRTNALPPGSGTGHHPAAAVAPRLVTGIEGPIPSVSGVTRGRLRMCPHSRGVILTGRGSQHCEPRPLSRYENRRSRYSSDAAIS